jgi:hypothetical protein
MATATELLLTLLLLLLLLPPLLLPLPLPAHLISRLQFPITFEGRLSISLSYRLERTQLPCPRPYHRPAQIQATAKFSPICEMSPASAGAGRQRSEREQWQGQLE